jgi:hypothetical protein
MEDLLVKTLDAAKRVGLSAVLGVLVAMLISAPMGSAQNASHALPGQKPTIDGRAKLQEILNALPNMHISKGIPSNFPVPSYTSNVVKTNFESTTKGPPHANASIVTRDRPDQVFQWYQDNCRKANWIVKVPSDKFMAQIGKVGKLYMLTGQKDKEEVRIFCTPSHKPIGTLVSILWTKKT